MEPVNKVLASGTLSPDELQTLKAKHNELHTVEGSTTDGKTVVGYFRNLRREEFSYLLTLEDNRFEQCTQLAMQTWVAGDEALKDDWKLLFVAGQALLEANKMPLVTLGKL